MYKKISQILIDSEEKRFDRKHKGIVDPPLENKTHLQSARAEKRTMVEDGAGPAGAGAAAPRPGGLARVRSPSGADQSFFRGGDRPWQTVVHHNRVHSALLCGQLGRQAGRIIAKRLGARRP